MLPINIDSMICLFISLIGYFLFFISYLINIIDDDEYGHYHKSTEWYWWLVVEIAFVMILLVVFTFFGKLHRFQVLLSSLISITLVWIIRDGNTLIKANNCKYYEIMGCGLFVVATGFSGLLYVVQCGGPITQITGRDKIVNNVKISDGLLV